MLYERIKYLADNRKVSFNQIEEAVGLPKNTLYRWKSIKPSIDKITLVADYFKVTTDYLLGRENKDYGTMFRMNTDGFSEEDTKEMLEELERYQNMYRLMILERKKKRGE